MNFLVIGLNQGMPVARQALVSSGQADTLDDLIANPYPKHHLASDDDYVVFLGDVIGGAAAGGSGDQHRRPVHLRRRRRSSSSPACGPRPLAARTRKVTTPSPPTRERCSMPADSDRRASKRPRRPLGLRLYELALTLPVLAYIAYSIYTNPDQFNDPVIFVWMAAIATVDLLPVPTTVSSVAFSLSFPLELSVALLYPTPVAALIAFCGSSDPRELRRDIPIMKALWIRAQIAVAVLCESVVFKSLATLESEWWLPRGRGHARGRRGLRGEPALRRRLRLPAGRHESDADPARDPRGAVRRVRAELHGPGALQRAGGHDLPGDRHPVDLRVHRAAGIRETDVHPNPFAAGSDERARREAGRERAPGVARLAHRACPTACCSSSGSPRRSTPRASATGASP